MSDNGAKMSLLVLPDDLICVIHDFRPIGSLSLTCRRICALVHLRCVFLKNPTAVPETAETEKEDEKEKQKVKEKEKTKKAEKKSTYVDAMVRYQTKHLRVLITENLEVLPLQWCLESVRSLETLSLTIYSPSLPYLHYLATLGKLVVALSVIFRTRREINERLGVLSETITRLSPTLKKYEIKFTNCQVTDVEQQILPRLNFPDVAESISLDLYRNRMLIDGMRSLITENLKLGVRAAYLNQLHLDFSGDPTANLPPQQQQEQQPAPVQPQNQVSQSIYLCAGGIKQAINLRVLGLIVDDCHVDLDALKTVIVALGSLPNLRSVLLSLNNNADLGDVAIGEMVGQIVDAWFEVRSLELRLQNVKMSDAGATELCKLATDAKGLERMRLFLSYNTISDDGIKVLETCAEEKRLMDYYTNLAWQLCDY